MQASPERIRPDARRLISDTRNVLLFSAASSWEIAIKHSIGRLRLPIEPADYVPSRMSTSGTEALPIHHTHALAVTSLPELHNDPFDRLLIAQALVEEATLITSDARILQYDVAAVRA